MNFRRINIEKDKAMLLEFRRDVNQISLGESAKFDEAMYLKRLKSRIKDFSEGQLIVEELGEPAGQIGFYTTEFEGTTIGYVNLLYLAPGYRGTGMGYELIKYVESYFSRHSILEYHLRVSPKNKKAYAFYVKMGMEKMREEDVGHIVWRMKKQL